MKIKKYGYHAIVLAGLIGMLLQAGCSSRYVMIAPIPPENYEVVGNTEGHTYGMLGIGPTAYNFVPIMLNSRAQRAYNAALANSPGATTLVNVTLQENWYWWILGSAKSYTISGTGVKE